MLALPIFPCSHPQSIVGEGELNFCVRVPCSHPQSIVGEGELNFCVRDGNRWTLTPINTNYISCSLLTNTYIIQHSFSFVKKNFW